jgi:hypothetical protein
VPITVDVVFDALPCTGDTSVLGAAAAVALFSGINKNGANPEDYCQSARCGDCVVDPEEACDGSAGCDARCAHARRSSQERAPDSESGRPDGGSDVQSDGGAIAHAEHSGCSCRTVRSTGSTQKASRLTLALSFVCCVARLRRGSPRSKNKAGVSRCRDTPVS